MLNAMLNLTMLLDNVLHSTSTRAQCITESMVHYICKDLRPYSVVDNVGFRWMLRITVLWIPDLRPCHS